MSDWPVSDRKMASHSNFKLRFCKRSLDLVWAFLFQFGMTGEVSLPRVIFQLKVDHLK